MNANHGPTGSHRDPVVSVVLPARNATATIGAQIDAVLAQESPVPFELIVVDSASDDGTGAFARDYAGVQVVRTETPGLNRARNVGIAQARGEVVLFCDADDVVHPGWLAAMHSASQRADYFGGPIELLELNDRSCREMWGVTDAIRTVGVSEPYPSPMGCNCGFRKEVWSTVGEFNETLFVANDEFEFFWRAGHHGFRHTAAPRAIVSYRLRAEPRNALVREYKAGISDTQLHHLTKSIGHRRQPMGTVLRTYGWVAKELAVGVVDRRRRWGGLRIGARRLGRAIEATRSRTLYL